MDSKDTGDKSVVRTEGERLSGKCKAYNLEKGYGFIKCDDGGSDVFVHQSEIQSDTFRCLKVDQRVEFIYSIRSEKPTGVKVTGPNGAQLITAATKKDAAMATSSDPNKVTGTVKWFNKTKGFGFIVQDSGLEDIFVHIGECHGLYPEEGQKVEYKVENKAKDGKEKTTACDVVVKGPLASPFPPPPPHFFPPPPGYGAYPPPPPPPGYAPYYDPYRAPAAAPAQYAGSRGDGVVRTGTMKWFNVTKGFGFIIPGDGSGKELYVSGKNVRGDPNSLTEGDHVEYSEDSSAKDGKTWAVDVALRSDMPRGTKRKAESTDRSGFAYKQQRSDFPPQGRYAPPAPAPAYAPPPQSYDGYSQAPPPQQGNYWEQPPQQQPPAGGAPYYYPPSQGPAPTGGQAPYYPPPASAPAPSSYQPQSYGSNPPLLNTPYPQSGGYSYGSSQGATPPRAW